MARHVDGTTLGVGLLHAELVIGVGGAGLAGHESEAGIRALIVLEDGEIMRGLVLALLGLLREEGLAAHEALVHAWTKHVGVGYVHGEIRGGRNAPTRGRRRVVAYREERGRRWPEAGDARREGSGAARGGEARVGDVEDVSGAGATGAEEGKPEESRR